MFINMTPHPSFSRTFLVLKAHCPAQQYPPSLRFSRTFLVLKVH